jgi:hypothetical protein
LLLVTFSPRKSNQKVMNSIDVFSIIFMRSLRLVQARHDRSAHPCGPALPFSLKGISIA